MYSGCSIGGGANHSRKAMDSRRSSIIPSATNREPRNVFHVRIPRNLLENSILLLNTRSDHNPPSFLVQAHKDALDRVDSNQYAPVPVSHHPLPYIRSSCCIRARMICNKPLQSYTHRCTGGSSTRRPMCASRAVRKKGSSAA